MSPFIQLALALAIILFFAKLAGYLSTLLNQPSVFGELVIGVILGPSLIDLFHASFFTDVHLGEIITEIGELGVLFLMFLAGLELHLDELTKNTRVAAFSGILGVVVPVLLGFGLGVLVGVPSQSSFYLGLTMGATSVSISAQTLMELKVLRSRVGLGLLGAAVFDDVLVILLLSAFLAVNDGGSSTGEFLLIFVRMVVFLAASVLFGIYVLPFLVRRIARLPISQSTLSFAIIILILYGLAAEILGGMAAITGSFIAGLMFARMPEKARLESGILSLAYGFFVPIFFVSIGLALDTHQLSTNALWLMIGVSILAILGKVAGCGIGARLGGFSWRESIQLGAGMSSRGEVGLIVASVGLKNNLINNEIFSAVIGMVLITTLVTPPLLRALFSKPAPSHQPST